MIILVLQWEEWKLPRLINSRPVGTERAMQTLVHLIQKLVFSALLPSYKENPENQSIELFIEETQQWYHRNLNGFSIWQKYGALLECTVVVS